MTNDQSVFLCNCTEDGYPYCGDPQCDIDYCNDCEGELPEIPLRSAQGLVGSEYRS